MKSVLMYMLLALPLISFAQDDCLHHFRENDPGSITTLALSNQFHRLKAENSACNRKWKSDLQVIMEELGTRLDKHGTHRHKILKYLGTPDYQADNIESVKLNPGEQIIVYHWRGWHDWLYFVMKNNRVVRVDWWYAYE